MAPLALKAAAAEMSVLMAYVRYWVCFFNLQLYKMVVFEVMKSDVVPYTFMAFTCIQFLH